MTVSINGSEIPATEIAAEMQYHPAPTVAAAQRKAACALAIRELLRQAAVRAGIAEGPEMLDRLLEQEVALPEPEEDDCRRYFEQNRRRFRSPTLVEARHILCAARKDDVDARAAAKARADAILSDLRSDPERFESIARDRSDCTSKTSGGHLGQLIPGSTVAEFEAVVFALPADARGAALVESRYGFHVVRVLARAEGSDLSYEQASERIRTYLSEAVWRRAVRQYIRVLAGQAEVVGADLDAVDSPLVQ
jgi:peptidyl-prolyl cis-trans isomerase C